MKSNHSSKQRSCLLLFLLEWRNLYEKQMSPRNFGGGEVDNRYKKRAMLTALLLGTLFCWGNATIKGADYSPKGINGEPAWSTVGNPIVNEIINDEINFSVIRGLNLTVEQNINPQIIKQEIKKEEKKVTPFRFGAFYNEDQDAGAEKYGWWAQNLPNDCTQTQANEIINIFASSKNPNELKQKFTTFNSENGTHIFVEDIGGGNDPRKEIWSVSFDSFSFNQLIGWNELKLTYANGEWSCNDYANGDAAELEYWGWSGAYKNYPGTETTTVNIQTTISTNLGNAAITITGSSSLTGKANVQTSKAINVNGNSKLTAAGSITGGSIASDKSTVKGASISVSGELAATNAGTISATNGNLSSNHITVSGGSTVSATGTITTTGISADNGKIQAGNLTANSLSIWNGSLVDISKGTLTVKGGETWLDAHSGKIKAKYLKVKNTAGHTNSIGSATHITGGLTLKGKAQTISAGAADTDVINKVQMTTALNNAKPKLGKTYSAGTGINLNTNNAVGLTNVTAYTTSDKKRISLVGAAKTYVKKVKTGKVSATSKDLINGSQLYSVQQSIAGFADRIQTNKNQLESLKSSINAKKTELSDIQKKLNTIKGTKLSQDMSNLTTDGEAVIKNQVKKAIQKFQKDMDVTTVQANVQEAKVTTTANALSSENNKPSIMLADAPIKATNEPVNAVSAISKEEVAAKADLSQTKINLEKKATLDTMDISAYTKQLSKDLATGESAYQAIQKAKEDRLVQAKENTLTVGANGTETKIDASKKNWTGILVDEKEAGSMANIGYVNQTLSMKSSYDKLSFMKKDLEKDTNKGIAKAAAMAALKPIGNDEEDKVSFAIGYGHYKDGNAAAIGTFYRPNQDILIHLDVTAGAGKPSMNTGVSFKVGKGSSYASMTREELAAENTAMKNQAEKQAERIQTQKEKIEHLESVMQSIRF